MHDLEFADNVALLENGFERVQTQLIKTAKRGGKVDHPHPRHQKTNEIQKTIESNKNWHKIVVACKLRFFAVES